MRVQSRNREVRDLKDMLNEECDMTDDFKNYLEKEHEVTRSLEQELKTLREKGDTPCEMNEVPHNMPRTKPRAGPSSRPMESTLIEQIQPVTTSRVVPEMPQWQLGGIDPEDWSDKEVTTPKPALSKRRLCKATLLP